MGLACSLRYGRTPGRVKMHADHEHCVIYERKLEILSMSDELYVDGCGDG